MVTIKIERSIACAEPEHVATIKAPNMKTGAWQAAGIVHDLVPHFDTHAAAELIAATQRGEPRWVAAAGNGADRFRITRS